MIDTTERLSKYVHRHGLELDDIKDISLAIVDRMVFEGLIPDCTDTENENYDQEEESAEVVKVLANGKDITDFYFEFFDTELFHDRILDYCRGK